MNMRRFIAVIVVCVSMLGFAGIASAISNDINVWGASAEFTFWTSLAPTFLTAEGCGQIQNANMGTGDTNQAITRAQCPASSGTYKYFRNGNKASFDGILAVTGNPNNIPEGLPNSETIYTETCVGSTCTATNVACNASPYNSYYRPMIDESSCTWVTGSTGTCTATKCVQVTGGTADVQAPSITQNTTGLIFGPNAAKKINGVADPVISRNFALHKLTVGGNVQDTFGNVLSDIREVVVPFGFFANVDVTGGGVTSIKTSDVQNIFSGGVTSWSDLGYALNQPINVCWRHAGSGTSSTLQLTQMLPAVLNNTQVVGGAGDQGAYNFYFNDGTGDEQYCVQNLSWSIGYFDADKSLASFPNIAPMPLNNTTWANGAALKALVEENNWTFWTVENLYYNGTLWPDMVTLATWLAGAGPAGVALPDAYYAYTCQLDYTKASDAAAAIYTGHTCPQ